MGAAPSTTLPPQDGKSTHYPTHTVHSGFVIKTKGEQEMIKLMMPLYYSSDEVTNEENEEAAIGWNLILQDKSPEYLRLKAEDPNFPHASCVSFFYDKFYGRLFDIHPLCKPLFIGGLKGQGKFLVTMLSFPLSQVFNTANYDQVLAKVAEAHAKKGVKTVEYGIVGEALFWSLRETLGKEFYNLHLHQIWVKIYSRMLRTIVPIAMKAEISGDGNHRVFESASHYGVKQEPLLKIGESRTAEATTTSISSNTQP